MLIRCQMQKYPKLAEIVNIHYPCLNYCIILMCAQRNVPCYLQHTTYKHSVCLYGLFVLHIADISKDHFTQRQ